ncbi:DMT family transporter [Sulfurisphaera tokodaii]|uniref:DMT family transporter n=2 Tax=Sulfurisphaera tokodaii TaxID=111955 RepID=Q976V2_SULTO|nr:DMT family transporter [Sulfurisphaera tokodaii]BAB65044.1 putative DMT family transporter [Sulfurisphaera tokodaii str. 7]HII74239.1 DMT family transporter [Sulfurisphaera tokodaii]
MSSTTLFVKWMIPVAIVWGLSYPLTKLVSEYSSPMIISVARVAVGFIFFYSLSRSLSIGVKQFINGLLNFVGLLTFLNLGVYFSRNPGLVAVMIYTQPLFILVIEYILGTRIKTKGTIGIILGVIGITAAAFVSFDLGLLFGLLGGLVWAIGTVYYRRNLLKEDIVRLNASMALTSLPILLVLTPIDFHFTFTLTAISLIIILALIAQVGGFFFWFNAVKYLGSIKAGTGSLLVPVMAYVLSYAFFRTIPTPIEIIGSAITLIGVYLTMTS